MNRVVLLFGPTASGKSALGISLADHFGGEIVSADSMQIYRGMDIGTAKATPEEQHGIAHHCLDLCDIHSSFSVAEYRCHAIDAIRTIHQKNKVAFVVGGTGQYFDALLFEPSYGNAAADEALRQALNEELSRLGNAALHKRLCEIDPVSGERIHVHDSKRIVRALEIHALTGKVPSEVMVRRPNTEFEFLSLFLNPDRATLYARCDKRVDAMLREGLCEEVSALCGRGLADTPTASQAIGYKELVPYLKGETTLNEAADLIRQRTRNYAKRQITWFKKMPSILLNASSETLFEEALNVVEEFLKGAPC